MINGDPAKPGIVWVASYPKSGNTWMRAFLYHLDRILNARPREKDELSQLRWCIPDESRLRDLFEHFLGQRLGSASRRQIAAVRPLVHAALAQRSGRMVLVKTHSVLGAGFGAVIINPAEAIGAIYLVRDPRDVAVSLAAHFGAPIDTAINMMSTPGFRDPENTSDKVYEIIGSWSEHVRTWTANQNEAVLVIRYRDLIEDPVTHFAAVARHLRWPPTAQQLAAAVELSSFDKLRRQEDKAGFIERHPKSERFFRKGKVGDWRDTLTQAQADRIVMTHGAMMARFGWREEPVNGVQGRGSMPDARQTEVSSR